jgi:hypothetical protein
VHSKNPARTGKTAAAAKKRLFALTCACSGRIASFRIRTDFPILPDPFQDTWQICYWILLSCSISMASIHCQSPRKKDLLPPRPEGAGFAQVKFYEQLCFSVHQFPDFEDFFEKSSYAALLYS